jgi:hypothetical protein
MAYTLASPVVTKKCNHLGSPQIWKEYSSHVLEEGAQCYKIPSYEHPVLLELKGIISILDQHNFQTQP